MIGNKAGIAALLTVVAILGCKDSATPGTASAAAGGSGTGGGALQNVPVTDPTLNNMTAWLVGIPSGWKLQGVVFQAQGCTKNPSVVYRATSPDGQSMTEQMPPFGWVWGTGPMATTAKTKDCLPLGAETTAQVFLTYAAALEHVGAPTPEQVPADQMALVQQQVASANAAAAQRATNPNWPAPKISEDLARASVTFSNGSVSMKGFLLASVQCTESFNPGMKSILRGMASTPPSDWHACIGYVTWTTAPESQYPAVVQQVTSPQAGARAQNDWLQAWAQRANQINQKLINQNDANFQKFEAQMQSDYNARLQMNEQMIQARQQSTDASIANANAAMQARSTAASDVVDFALDQQTVVNTKTNQVTKLPNQVTPGAPLQPVHGNGTPH